MTANTAYAISAALTPPKSPAARLKAAGEATEATASDGPTRTVLAVRAKAKVKVAKVDVEESRVDAYLAHLQQVIPHHGLSVPRHLTADGYFGKVKFVDGIKALGLDLISKLRRDRCV